MKLHTILFRMLDILDNLVARIHWFFSEERRNPYRCPVCGGIDVHVRAWVRPNFGSRYVGDCEDFPEENCDWCETCREKVHARTSDWFEMEVNAWWSRAGFPIMERVTGYRQDDFDPEDGYQDFVDACNEWWHKQTIEKKIKIWNKQK